MSHDTFFKTHILVIFTFYPKYVTIGAIVEGCFLVTNVQ